MIRTSRTTIPLALTALATLGLALTAGARPGTSERWVWSGEVRGAEETVVDPAVLRAELEEELRRVRFEYQRARDLTAALGALEALHVRATFEPGFEGQEAVLAEVVRARGELVARAGDQEGARALAERVLLAGPGPEGEGALVRIPATERAELLAREVRERLADFAPVAETLGSLEGPDGGAPPKDVQASSREEARALAYVTEHFGPVTKSLLAHVRESLASGSTLALRSLGLRAAPALAVLVLRSLSEQGSFARGLDPLPLLLEADPQGGGRLVLDHLDAGGLDWSLRLLSVLEAQGFLASNANWVCTDTAPRRPESLRPEWIEVLAYLVGQRGTRARAIELVPQVLRWDALSPRLADALVEVLHGTDEDAVDAVLRACDSFPAVESARPVYVAALARPDERSAVWAANQLLDLGARDALRANAAHPLAEVRRLVAVALGEHNKVIVVYRTNGWENGVPSWSNPLYQLQARPQGADFGPADMAALGRLLADPDPGVRAAAVESLLDAGSRAPHELLERALTDADPAVRAAVPESGCDDPELLVRLLAELVDDPDRRVLDAIDRVLVDELDWKAPPEGAFELVAARLEREDHPLERCPRIEDEEGLVHFLTRWVGRTLEGRLFVLRWSARAASDERLLAVARELWRRDRDLSTELAPGEFARLFAVASHADADLFSWMMGALRRSAVLPLDGLLSVMGDGEADPVARLQAASLAATAGGSSFERAFAALLVDDAWRGRGLSEGEREVLSNLELPPGRADAIYLAALRDGRTDDGMLQALLRAYRGAGPTAATVANEILRRWLDAPGAPIRAVREALEVAGEHRGEGIASELLLRAGRHPAYADDAVEAMCRRKSPEFLPLLGAYVVGQDPSLPSLRVPTREIAARTLTAYEDPRAVEYLLEGLRGAEPQVQGAILSSLEMIETYERRRGEWERRGAGLEDRERAAADLLGMLQSGSPVVRAEAARGLATFGALEAIPRLIPLLEDGDESVRRAAREALDALHALGRDGDQEGDGDGDGEGDGAAEDPGGSE